MKIPAFKLDLIPLDEESKYLKSFQWADESVGSRHQLGGNPTFLQDSEYPDCECCKERMTFYAQLDSLNDDFVIADCGMIYVFFCFVCNEVKSIVQSG